MERKSPPNSKNKRSDRYYLKYAGLGVQLTATILIGMYVGFKVDEWMNMSKPLFTVAFSLIFIIIALYLLVKDLLKE